MSLIYFDRVERRLPGDGGPPAKLAGTSIETVAKACEGIALFSNMHADDRKIVFSSMYSLSYSMPGEKIVQQGL